MNTLKLFDMEMQHELGEDVQEIFDSIFTMAKLNSFKITCSKSRDEGAIQIFLENGDIENRTELYLFKYEGSKVLDSIWLEDRNNTIVHLEADKRSKSPLADRDKFNWLIKKLINRI